MWSVTSESPFAIRSFARPVESLWPFLLSLSLSPRGATGRAVRSSHHPEEGAQGPTEQFVGEEHGGEDSDGEERPKRRGGS
jgi:hypothetical protein